MIDATKDDRALDASEQYVGRWNTLVSTTNWEKGKIIHQWRTALVDSAAPASTYSDEAWAQRVGGVSSQHVGRLRRVFERFDQSQQQFPGLYWSHFAQSLDWDDAEMWLEGAVQNGWSVAQTREQRNSTLGLSAEAQAASPEVEFDEDAGTGDSPPLTPSIGVVQDTQSDDDSDGDDDHDEYGHGESAETASDAASSAACSVGTEAPVRPFESLAELPADLADALEEFKLAILRHKLARWADVSRENVLAHLDALRALVLAPADEPA